MHVQHHNGYRIDQNKDSPPGSLFIDSKFITMGANAWDRGHLRGARGLSALKLCKESTRFQAGRFRERRPCNFTTHPNQGLFLWFCYTRICFFWHVRQPLLSVWATSPSEIASIRTVFNGSSLIMCCLGGINLFAPSSTSGTSPREPLLRKWSHSCKQLNPRSGRFSDPPEPSKQRAGLLHSSGHWMTARVFSAIMLRNKGAAS